jgi:penicillin G amidase
MFPRWLRLCAYLFAFGLLVVGLFVYVPLYHSLPDRGGHYAFPGLAGVSAVQRDDNGIVRISANNRRDAAKLLGFVHAQDRFFQMDLLRRTAAGELAELLGPAALPLDRTHRRLRLREVAHAALEKLPEPQREIIEDYALGVSTGLRELESDSFEYLLLHTKPAPWKAEDSFLVAATLALIHQRTDGEPELSRSVVRDVFAPGTADFLLSAADDFESALDDSHIEAPALPAVPEYAPSQLPSPGNAELQLGTTTAAPNTAASSGSDLGARICAAWTAQLRHTSDEGPGGNAFVIRGQQGQRAVALLANDIHSVLLVPNAWYRAEILWRTDPRHIRTLDGITLPGLPFLVAGSNGALAWGFTNAFADTSDLVLLETDPANPRRYRTPDGWRELESRTETLAVRGAAPETFAFDTTIWGPVIGSDHRGRTLALHWTLADPAAYDLQFSELETTNSARAALAFAKHAGFPQFNILVADREGNIGWTVTGRLPRRIGFDGSTPTSWADGSARWDGWLPLADYPQIYNPTSGRLWSADNRMLGGEALDRIGDTGRPPAARARQLRDRLATLKEITPESLLGIQLDTRGLYLERWQQLLLATLDSAATSAAPARAELRALAENWGGQAVPDSASYRLVHDFRAAVLARVDTLVFARCRAAYPAFDSSTLPLDRIAFTLASSQPAGWHPQGTTGWRQLLLDAADTTIAAAGGPGKLAQFTWGKANRLAMRHPFGSAFPGLAHFLDMSSASLPGDPLVLRAQTPTFGASVRMVIQPGWEAGSLLQMPGGQSAHPLSPYYSDGHQAWLKGEPTPLQPGKVDKHAVFVPPTDE